jgi:ABC-2 type transport system ATP-binding protein
VGFTVGAGEVCAIVGPNGAGKSTLFRILTGLTTPTSGSATILGWDTAKQSRKVRRHVGFMPADDRSLFLRQTCAQNLDFHGRLQGMPSSERARLIDETLELVGLGHARDRSGFALSTGMRARLQLGRALLHRPKVLILDEPTGPVDPIGAHELLGSVQRITSELGLAVLLSSHRLEEIDALGDNVVFLDRGQLVHWGALSELRQLWEVPQVVIKLDTPTAADAASGRLDRSGLTTTRVEPSDVVVSTDLVIGEVLTALGPDIAHVRSIEAHRMPLRDLLAQLVRLRDQSAHVERATR